MPARYGTRVYTYKNGWDWPVARLLEVGDGDSVKLAVDHGFEEDARVWIRLADVGAPERNEPADWARAKADVEAWFAEHAPDGQVRLTTFRTSKPLEIRFRQTFTRYVGVVASPSGVELNAWLIDKGWLGRGE
jgi:endonuclease YncB( thermonuclease family)